MTEEISAQEKDFIATVNEAGSEGLLIVTNQPRLSLIARTLVMKGLLKRTHRLIGSIYSIPSPTTESEA